MKLNLTKITPEEYNNLENISLSTIYWLTDGTIYTHGQLYGSKVVNVDELPEIGELNTLYIDSSLSMFTWNGEEYVGANKVYSDVVDEDLSDEVPTIKAIIDYVAQEMAKKPDYVGVKDITVRSKAKLMLDMDGEPDKSIVLPGIVHDPTYDKDKRIIRLPLSDSDDVVIDLGVDKCVTAGKYDAENKNILLTTDPNKSYADKNKVITISLKDIIAKYNTADTKSIGMGINAENAIYANVKISSEANNAIRIRDDGLYSHEGATDSEKELITYAVEKSNANTDAIDGLRSDVATVNNKISDYDSYKEKLDSLETDVNEVTVNLSATNHKVENNTESISNLSSSVSTVKSDVSGLKTKTNNLQNKIDNIINDDATYYEDTATYSVKKLNETYATINDTGASTDWAWSSYKTLMQIVSNKQVAVSTTAPRDNEIIWINPSDTTEIEFFDTDHIAIGTTVYEPGLNTLSAGDNCNAIGDYSFANGMSCFARGIASAVFGKGNSADSDYQFVCGKYANKDIDKALIVGGGTSTRAKKNIHTIDWSGNAYYAGSVESSGLILKDANGTKYTVTVNTDGQLVTEQLSD